MTKQTNIYLPDVTLRDDNGRKCATLRRRTIDDHVNALDWAIEKRDDPNVYFGGSSVSKGEWSGTETVEEYRDMLRDGWREGVEEAEGLDGLSSDMHERLQFVRNVGGVFPLVPAAIAGAPDAMLDVRPMPADNVRAVTLIVDGSFNAGVASKTSLEYARSVMRLVAWLQAEQIDASVYVSLAVQMRQQRVIYLTQIRRSGDILQPERIATCVHPSWLRRAWFALCEREYQECKLPGTCVSEGGYGQSRHATADELRQALPDAASVIVLPKVGDGDPEQAVQEALSVKLRQQEV